MPQYQVNLKRTEYGFVNVEAKNKEEAEEAAIDAEQDGNAIWNKADLKAEKVIKLKN